MVHEIEIDILETSNDISSYDSPSNYEVPTVLARPFVEVCILLGIPPVLTAAATDLWNWKLKDESKPISFSNMTCITTMTGTSTEMNFHIIPCVMHFYAAPLIMQIFDAPELICNHNEYGLKRLIDDISQMIEKCREVQLGNQTRESGVKHYVAMSLLKYTDCFALLRYNFSF